MKRLVVCADGTWNLRDQVDDKTNKRRPTNVTKVARAVKSLDAEGVEQIVIYHEGVGTGSGVDKYTGGAFGSGIEDNLRSLYRSILYNYVSGDELFLFGFSRGAFTLRTLLGFIKLVGLIDKTDDYWLPEIYACYARGLRPGSAEWDKAFSKVTKAHLAPKVKFIGVWDTVGALGAPGFFGQLFGAKKYAYHDVSLNDNIQNAYQALAIDEHRKAFAPSIWSAPPGWVGKLRQVWFVGSHGDVGGGNSTDGLANEALHWIVEKAELHDLEFESEFLRSFRPCFNGEYHDSMTRGYRLFGRIDRPIGTAVGGVETIHQSVLDRLPLKLPPKDQPNLKAYLAMSYRPPPEDTNRVPRGTPC